MKKVLAPLLTLLLAGCLAFFISAGVISCSKDKHDVKLVSLVGESVSKDHLPKRKLASGVESTEISTSGIETTTTQENAETTTTAPTTTATTTAETTITTTQESETTTSTTSVETTTTNVVESTIETSSVETSTIESTTSEKSLITYQYIIIDKEYPTLDLTINLENEKDYHIFDFNLKSSDETTKILIDGEYVLLNSLDSINWRGDTNKSYTIRLSLSEELDNIQLDITNIYYSDRENGKNTYTADLNKKGTFYVFETTGLMEIDYYSYNNGLYTYYLHYEDQRIANVKVNGELDYQEYIDLEQQSIIVEYDYVVSDTISLHKVLEYSINLDTLFNAQLSYNAVRQQAYVLINRNWLGEWKNNYIVCVYKDKELVAEFTCENDNKIDVDNEYASEEYDLIVKFDVFEFKVVRR